MQIWHYRSDTHELVGVGTADPNPLEPGEWILPAHSTPVEPPAAEEGKKAVFFGSSWQMLVDRRGELWWPKDAADNTVSPVLIDAFGDPTERGLTNVEPPVPVVPVPVVTVTAWQIRRALNQLGLRAAIESFVSGSNDLDIHDAWQFANEFHRDHELIVAAAQALGKTSEEVDAVFNLAKTL